VNALATPALATPIEWAAGLISIPWIAWKSIMEKNLSLLMANNEKRLIKTVSILLNQ